MVSESCHRAHKPCLLGWPQATGSPSHDDRGPGRQELTHDTLRPRQTQTELRITTQLANEIAVPVHQYIDRLGEVMNARRHEHDEPGS